MAAIAFTTLRAAPRRLVAPVLVLAALIAAGLAAALYMESNGHWVTGMTNRVVWGLPHVFAIFLIVAASGALNVASIGSVFQRVPYKPLAPLSGLLAVALLVGGLAVLVLDLGRPDRLTVAMTHYNPRSIFAWNIFLYTGFLAVVAVYLWTMMVRRLGRYSAGMGRLAFVWRLVLTTGTGSIFGFLVARDTLHSAAMAPLFIAMSFAFGLAVFLIVLAAVTALEGGTVAASLWRRLGRLLGVFVAGQAYFVLVLHLTDLYAANGRAMEAALLTSGNLYCWLFWLGEVGLGVVLPLWLLFRAVPTRGRALAAAVAVVVGGLVQIYVIVIGGEAYPLDLLPGYVLRSGYGDGQWAAYAPTLPEALLGISGMAIAAAVVLLGCWVLRFLPADLSAGTEGE